MFENLTDKFDRAFKLLKGQGQITEINVAESLKPYYRQFCKRPCFHDEYLDTYNRENVTLVDTQGKGLEKITEKGIFFDGKC